MLTEHPFSAAFARALRGESFSVVGLHERPVPLPADTWSRVADEADLALVRHCVGATINIGCGPGRLSAALGDAGHVALGIDVVGEAVEQTTRRGAAALRCDVFGSVPAEGRWDTALLADGNVGIGGDPVQLLRRAAELVAPGGRIVVELAEPGVVARTVWAVIESTSMRSRPFRWAVVGVDDIATIASTSGLAVASIIRFDHRWGAVLL